MHKVHYAIAAIVAIVAIAAWSLAQDDLFTIETENQAVAEEAGPRQNSLKRIDNKPAGMIDGQAVYFGPRFSWECSKHGRVTTFQFSGSKEADETREMKEKTLVVCSICFMESIANGEAACSVLADDVPRARQVLAVEQQ